MTEARDEFARRLNGREYRDEMTFAEEAHAKAERLLIVFGASDDLTEFRGIIHDEAGAYNSTRHLIIGNPGKWKIWENTGARQRKPRGAVTINAEWCPKEPNASWLISPSVQFAPFDIMEDGELYCRGAVIDEADLLPAQRVLGIIRNAHVGEMMFVSFSAPLTDDDIRSIHDFLREWRR